MIFFIVSCVIPSKNNTDIYKSKSFSIKNNAVIQGKNRAVVISKTHIKSNYKSPENKNYSNLINFKFSINEKDNELPLGKNHQILITNQKESKVFIFGKSKSKKVDEETSKLPVNYKFTFKVDMNPVLNQFKEKGYYNAIDGSKIAKADFKGFYIAGGSLPMTWDFVSLDERGLELTDKDNDGIFEITLILNPLIKNKEKEWQLTKDLSKKAQYSSDQPLVDALYNMSLEEAKLAIEPESTFRTGAKWAGVWTRDISYSIVLAFAYLEPEVAKISLMKKVNRNRIIQDTGSGGAWPVSSDRTTWALAAWEIYKTTLDKAWLKKAYAIIKNTVADDFLTIHSKETNMFSGESSFLDWREQTYPKWMSNKDIYTSQNLGTNVVHYQTYVILSKMAKILGEPSDKYLKIAAGIKKGINDYLWMKDKGYYAQYLYGRHYLIPSKRYEALGESLAIIFDVANEEQCKLIIEKSPLTEFGATCIYPQIPNIPPYHNNAIWPFVQAYWNLAAAKAGNEKVLNHGLAAIYRAAGLYLTNYENMVAETGDFKGTEINSNRMLWSMAGNLAMVYRVFMGMKFDENQLILSPVIPKVYGGNRQLKNFKYVNAILDITIEGFGNKIASVTIDGKKVAKAIIAASLEGKHTVHIVMLNNNFSTEGINVVENKFSLANPQVKLNRKELSWEPVVGAVTYVIYRDGKRVGKTNANTYKIKNENFAEFSISAIDNNGIESFISEPVTYSIEKSKIIEAEGFALKSNLGYVNYSGTGFVEVSNNVNKEISFQVNVEIEGNYFLDFRYSNGSGPWNTDNKCAIRSLYLNTEYVGAVVFPQRGIDEWSDWGYSNSYKINFKKGKNILKLSLQDWNINMNVSINKAMIDYMRLYKIN